MSPKRGRHHRGPGGPTRTSRSGRTSPPASGRRHRPDVSGLVDPTIEQLVTTVLVTAGQAIPPGHPAPGVVLEQWAGEMAITSFAAEEMPRAFYVDLGAGLAGSDDPLAPAALAALAAVVDHRDADPLRRAHREWLADQTAEGRDADLSIGREAPVAAVTIGAPDEAQLSVVIGFTAAGHDHSAGLLVDGDDGGIARDLWVGPAIGTITTDARADPDLVVTDLPLSDARALAEEALAAADRSGGFLPDDERILPLLTRRLRLIG